MTILHERVNVIVFYLNHLLHRRNDCWNI